MSSKNPSDTADFKVKTLKSIPPAVQQMEIMQVKQQKFAI